MRRPTRLGLLAAIVVLVVLGGYTAFWFVAAGRIADAAGEWAESLRPRKLDLSWHDIRVRGFPLAFRAELSGALLHDDALSRPAEIRVPQLSASVHLWNFRLVRLAAPAGLTATFGPADHADVTLTAQSAAGTVSADPDGSARIELTLEAPVAETGLRVAAESAGLRVTLPLHPPRSSEEPAVEAEINARAVNLPQMPAPLQGRLDDAALGIRIMGPVPVAAPRQAAAAWRDAGGTLEVDRLALRWGSLAISGSGTVALDDNLQPIASFSAAIEGYDQLLSALAGTGRVRANDIGLARLALGFLAKRGADGRPQITAPFTIQDGQMFLGPVKLGPAPRIDWQ